ncbi:LOW QUALITY PROTEIN: uncharacterized protein LOC124169510 [Ischnura elegans]|uniref:LOW QUALITY PROTEIN: uncharacterized protein LOC124169510 n=1 Tax=Ischnura elegans TaxID=197161 RepID=UPI001ED8A12D|nr:LOW QUALITY PROTEIN: uncharacterized protein LOC124169510 [Ischnura elegans]
MSTLSGLATKGEKGKSKFQSLDINSLYRGESLEPAQKTILRKHGMQSLGRVPCARRAPANLPSLKAETSGADPPVSLVPSGGTGWGSKPPGEGTAPSATPASTQVPGPAAVAALLPPATLPLTSSTTQPTSQTPIPQSRQPQPVTGPVGGAATEFPQLSGSPGTDGVANSATSAGNSVSGATPTGPKSGTVTGVDVQYGPGPSLRPQSMVGDGLGARGAGLGALPTGPSTPLGQTPVVGPGSGGVVPGGVGGAAPMPSAGVGAAAGGGGGAGAPFPGIMPHFMYRGGFPGPGGFPPNFQASLHGNAPRPQRFGYPSAAGGQSGAGGTEGEGGPGARYGQAAGGRPPGPPSGAQGGPSAPPEDEVLQRPIIKEEDLNKMDDIVRGNGWATQDDIDYNQKLTFSDDESTEDDGTNGHLSRKEAAAQHLAREQARGLNQNISVSQHHHSLPLMQQPTNPPMHMHLKGKESENRRGPAGPPARGVPVPEDERDGHDLDHRDDARGRMDDRGRDSKRLEGNRMGDARGGWGQPGGRPAAPPPLMPPSMMDFRGGPRGGGNMGVSPPQQGPASMPPAPMGNLMQAPFKISPHMPFGGAGGRLLDDDEVWREKRKKTNEEVAIAVVRAKQRKEEEEKKFEESKQAAAKKLQNLEEKMGVNKEKKETQPPPPHHPPEEGSPEWERDCSRTSSEGREEKPVAPPPPTPREPIREIPRDSPGERDFRPAPPLMVNDRGGGAYRDRDMRERERERHDYKFSRQFQSNLPPRFQRQQQQAEQHSAPPTMRVGGPPSPPPTSRPRPATGPTPSGAPTAPLTPSPPSVTSSDPTTPVEGRGPSNAHDSRWGPLGSSQPPLHYGAQGISGMKSGGGPLRRGVRDDSLPTADREREGDREREERPGCMERGRGGISSDPPRGSNAGAPPDVRDKERTLESKRVIPTSSEDRDRRIDDRYRPHGRDVRGPPPSSGYLDNGRRGYYDGPDYGRGYGRGPSSQDYGFERGRNDREHLNDADAPRFNDSRHGAPPSSRDFDPWEREKERHPVDKDRIPEGRDRPMEKERDRVINRDRERLNEHERVPERERLGERERDRGDRVLDRDRDGRDRLPDRDSHRDRVVDRELLMDRGPVDRVERLGERGVDRDVRLDRDRPPERERPCDRVSDRDRLSDRELERDHISDRPERVGRGPSDRDRPSERDRLERDRPNDRDRQSDRDRPGDRDRPSERDRPSDRDRPIDRDRPSERERPSDRDRNGERDRAMERERVNDRDRASDRDRPIDRERPVERERQAERDRPMDRDQERSIHRERERPSERDRNPDRERGSERDRIVDRDRASDRDRPVERNFDGDVRSVDRAPVPDRDRNHDRVERERVVPRDRPVGRDRGVVSERDVDRERTQEMDRTYERDHAVDTERGVRQTERGLERLGSRENEYRDVRRYDDRRGDLVDNKKVAEPYPERRESFEPEIESRPVMDWRDPKEWKDDRRSGALLGESRRQGSEDRPQRPDSRDERGARESRGLRDSNREAKSGQLSELSGEVGGKGPPTNGGRRGEYVSSSSWADAPVEPLYPEVAPEEKKEEYFRNEHRSMMETSSNDRKAESGGGVGVNEGAWGFPRGGPPSACAQGHTARGPGAEPAGVAGVAAGAPPTRGPPNRLSPSPPAPTTTTTPTPSGEGPPSPGRPPRAGPPPLGANCTAPPPPLLPPPRPQRQLSNTSTPTTPAGGTTSWADAPPTPVDLMPPQEERSARDMLPSAGEGTTMMDGKALVNDKAKTDVEEKAESDRIKEEEKKDEDMGPKRERGGRGRSSNQSGSRNRQQGSLPQPARGATQWGSSRGGNTTGGRPQRAPGMKWTAEEEEEESEVRAGEGDSEFSAEEEGSGESGRELRGVRGGQLHGEVENDIASTERNSNNQDVKRTQGREGFAPRGEPSRRGRGGGAGFRTRGNLGRRMDRYGPPPSGCPFGQPREEGTGGEVLEEQGDGSASEKGKGSRGQAPGPVGSGKDGASNRSSKSSQGSSSAVPPRMQRRGETERSRKGRGGRGGGNSGETSSHRSAEGTIRKHPTGPDSRQGSSDVAEWETTSENSDADDSGRERRESKRGKGQRGWSEGIAPANNSTSGVVGSGIPPTSRAPGAEKKSGSNSSGPVGSGQRTSPAPTSRGKGSGKGKEEGGSTEGSRRGGGAVGSGSQNRSGHTPLMGVSLDIGGEKALEGIDIGTYSNVAPSDDRHPGAEDQGDAPFPFDADGSGFREVRGRRGGGRVGGDDSLGSQSRQQQQSSQRQQRREGAREGRGGKGVPKGQAPGCVGRPSGSAGRTGTPSPGPVNSISTSGGPLRPGSPSSVTGGSFERNRPKLPPRLIKQKETERLQKQQAQQQQQQGRGPMAGSFGNQGYHSHHGAPSNHLRNDVGEVNHHQQGQHHHQGKMVGSSGVLFPMKDSNSGAISGGVNAWEKPLASSAIGSSSPASSSSGGVGIGNLGTSVGEERGGENGSDRGGSHAVVSGMNSTGGVNHRESPTGAEVGASLGNGVTKVPSVQKLTVEKPSSVLLDGTSPPVQTIIFENTNYKSGPPSSSAAQVPKFNNHHHHHHHHSHKMQRVIEKGRGNDRKLSDDSDDGVSLGYGSAKDLGKVGSMEVKSDPMQLPLGFAKNAEDSTEMKLDFAFHSELSQLTEEKAHSGGSVKGGGNSPGGGAGGAIGGSMALQRNMHVTSTIGTAAELNYKIAAVKTFWENTPPMPTVLEISEGNDGSSVVVASSSVAAATSASPSSSSPSSLAPGVVAATAGFVVDQPSSSVVVMTGEDGSGLNATEVAFSPGTPMQVSNSFGVTPASLGKGDPGSTSSNVCKVKPQQQTAVMSTGPSPIGHPGPLSPPPYNSSSAQATAGHINYQPTIGGTAQFGSMSAIPSPPSVIFNSSQQIPAQGGLYGTFPIDGQVLGGGARSQFPQFASPYGLSQSIGGTSAFSPQSMYLHQAAHPQPPPTAAPDMYPSSLSQYRLQAAAAAAAGVAAPYGGSGHHVGGTTPPQAPTAVLIPTPPTNSLAAMKPPPSQGQSTNSGQGGGGGGAGAGPQQPPPSQGGPPGAVGSKGAGGHYGGAGTLGSGIPSAPQPSPLYIQYNDQGQAVLNHSFLSAGSQMVQRPGPVQSTVVPPPIQPPTSFYSTSAGRHFTLFAGGQTGFYQPGSSGLGQAAQLHQTAAAAVAAAAASSQFGLAQGFGPSQSAPAPVGLQNFGSQMAAAQQYRSNYLKSGGGGGGSGIGGPSEHLQQGRSQLKSPSANPGSQQQPPPPDVLTSAFSSAPQIPSPKSRNTKLQGVPVGGQGNQPQQPSPTQPTSHPKFSSYTPVAALVLQQQQSNSVRNQMSGGMGGLLRGSGSGSNSMNSAPSRYPAPIQRPVPVPPVGGNTGRHRMQPQPQRTTNIGKHYFGQDAKGEDGNDDGKIGVESSKSASARSGDTGATPTVPTPPGTTPTTGQSSTVPTPSTPTAASTASDPQVEGGQNHEEARPSSGGPAE